MSFTNISNSGSSSANDIIVPLVKNSAAATAAGTEVSALETLVFDTSLRIWNIGETGNGSITYDILDASHLSIKMPSTASAADGDHIIFEKSGGTKTFFIIIQKTGTPPIITGSWVAGPDLTNKWIYVVLPGGNTAAQNNALLLSTLNANSDWTNASMVAQAYNGGDYLSPEASVPLMVRKVNEQVFMSISGFNIASFSGTTEELKIPAVFIPPSFRPNNIDTHTVAFPIVLTTHGLSWAVFQSNGDLLIYPNSITPTFANAATITSYDINIEWTKGDFPS